MSISMRLGPHWGFFPKGNQMYQHLRPGQQGNDDDSNVLENVKGC